MADLDLCLAVLASTTIGDEQIPLSCANDTFAIANLVFMLLTVIEAIFTVTTVIRIYKKAHGLNQLGPAKQMALTNLLHSKRTDGVLSIPIVAIAIGEFIVTEDPNQKMVLFDQYTIIMAVFLLIETALMLHAHTKMYQFSGLEAPEH